MSYNFKHEKRYILPLFFIICALHKHNKYILEILMSLTMISITKVELGCISLWNVSSYKYQEYAVKDYYSCSVKYTMAKISYSDVPFQK